jgi:hypothetical protein
VRSTILVAIAALAVGFAAGGLFLAGPDRLEPRRPRPEALSVFEEACAIYRRFEHAEMPDDLAAEALDRSGKVLPVQLARFAARYERLREQVGTLRDPRDILLEIRDGDVDLVGEGMRKEGCVLSPVPSSLAEPLGNLGKGWAYARCGVIPLGQVLVIERVDLEVRMSARYSWKGPRRCELRIANDPLLAVGWTAGAMRLVYRGRAFVLPGEEHLTRLSADLGSFASVRLSGRLVPQATLAELEAMEFRAVVEESTGFLQRGPILMQVLADHGGGRPRTLCMDGSHNLGIDRMVERNLWSGKVDVRELQNSTAYVKGGGIIPPGHVFLLRRVEYRAGLDPDGRRQSTMVIRAGKETLVAVGADADTSPSGTWRGHIPIRPGEEQTVSLSCGYYALGEARFYGRLVEDDTERTR